MLTKMSITLENNCGLNQSAGSLMQGVLMENIDEIVAAELHQHSINPYAQYLDVRKDSVKWIISTLNEQAKKDIILPLMTAQNTEFNIKQRNASVKIQKKELQEITYENMIEQTYLGKCKPYLTLDFVSPTAFKVDGRYQFYPTPFHIFQSLARKYDAVCKDNSIFSEELMNEITESVSVFKYNLRSVTFGLEGVKIPAFKGQIGMRIHGPQMFVNLIHMLAVFGTYSGVGIKTAMGMGAVNIAE